jgi:DNA-binding transcriptional LysR family regulator
MNLKKLEAFILVVEKNSFSEAAAALKSSQPTVSLKIKSLEEDLGFELLDRGAAGIRPTPAGMLVYSAARDMLKRWTSLEDELKEFEGTLTGTLTVGASTIPGTYLLPGWIKIFRSIYPKVEVRVEIGDSRKVLDKIHGNQVDVGIIGLHEDSRQIKSKPIAADSIVLITPVGHPLAESKGNGFADLKQYEFVMREEGSGTRKMMEEFLAVKGLSSADLKTSISMGSTEAVIAGVEAGLGISFISRLAAQPAAKANRIQIIDQFEPYERAFYFVTHADNQNRTIIKQFAETVTNPLTR